MNGSQAAVADRAAQIKNLKAANQWLRDEMARLQELNQAEGERYRKQIYYVEHYVAQLFKEIRQFNTDGTDIRWQTDNPSIWTHNDDGATYKFPLARMSVHRGDRPPNTTSIGFFVWKVPDTHTVYLKGMRLGFNASYIRSITITVYERNYVSKALGRVMTFDKAQLEEIDFTITIDIPLTPGNEYFITADVEFRDTTIEPHWHIHKLVQKDMDGIEVWPVKENPYAGTNDVMPALCTLLSHLLLEVRERPTKQHHR